MRIAHLWRLFAVFAIILFSSFSIYAQEEEVFLLDEVVVTAVAEPIPLSETVSSVTVVTKEEIERKNPVTLEELLTGVTDLHIYNQGVNTASIFIRGANSGHTMVLIDGVPFADPSGTSGGFGSIGALSPLLADHIEVVAGPSSAFYGSGAMGGVVNIITKKDAGSSVYAQGGSYGAYGAGGVYSGKYFTAGASYYNEDGISLADKKFGAAEKDGYTAKSFFVKHYLDDFNGYHHEISLMQNTSHVEYDGDQVDYANYADTTYTTAKFSVGYKVNEYWDPTLSVGTVVTDRLDHGYNAWGFPPAYEDTSFSGLSNYAELANKLTFGKIATVNLGGKYTKDEASTTASYISYVGITAYSETKEVYLNGVVKPLTGLNIQLGGRFSDVEGFKETYTYTAGASYLIEPIRLTVRAATGTAFKAPTLDNLYSPYWGNKDLKAQNSSSWEVGLIEEILPKKLSLNITYFDTEFKNRISFVTTTYPAGYFTNSDTARTKGIEAGITANISVVFANLSYTYTDFEEITGGVKATIDRRPENKGKASVAVKPIKEFTATLEAVYVDKMTDNDWVAYQPVTLSDYTLVSLYLSYEPQENFTLFANAKNLLDKEYANAYGYAAKGLDIVGGIKYSW
ncbi:MAG: TonB-dependent receptor [Deferribacteraceae bacterium]|jgi:vitamin B12 transporter|nr:TonB-dependent receptor [Deferribacteraceae bacterium]